MKVSRVMCSKERRINTSIGDLYRQFGKVIYFQKPVEISKYHEGSEIKREKKGKGHRDIKVGGRKNRNVGEN